MPAVPQSIDVKYAVSGPLAMGSWSSRLGHARRLRDQAVDRYGSLFPNFDGVTREKMAKFDGGSDQGFYLVSG
jgi:hypothetical protein